MFSFIMLVGVTALFSVSFILIVIDLLSSKRHQNTPPNKNFPKLTTYSLTLTLISLFLLVFISVPSSV
ncbi:MAG: hypothetical protein ACFFDX_09515 [Candidatus Odinarchaeota archaeon]